MIFVVGGRGRLGQAIAAEYSAGNVVLLERAIYEDWSQDHSRDRVSRYFDKKAVEGSVVFVASGLLDPRLSQEELLRINFHLPKNIIEGTSKLRIKVVTFGTVMEGLLTSTNPYVQSKATLGAYVADVASTKYAATHLRLHTLYGVGEPSPFMFLGQMLEAIHRSIPFDMTPGKQLREYHHVEDEVRAIRKIVESATPGVLDVSHGQPISLKEIAENVFLTFGKEKLLRVGALPERPEENYERIFVRPEILKGIQFRDSLPAIIDYMKRSVCTQK